MSTEKAPLQLPCRTFVSAGTCPFRSRCQFLHDPRCLSRGAKTKTRKKNAEDSSNTDSFFWPKSIGSSTCQRYLIPEPRIDKLYRQHDHAVQSLWHHFVSFCELTANNPNLSEISFVSESHQQYMDHQYTFNLYTGSKRLSIFVELSCGRSTSKASSFTPSVMTFNTLDDDIQGPGSPVSVSHPCTPTRVGTSAINTPSNICPKLIDSGFLRKVSRSSISVESSNIRM